MLEGFNTAHVGRKINISGVKYTVIGTDDCARLRRLKLRNKHGQSESITLRHYYRMKARILNQCYFCSQRKAEQKTYCSMSITGVDSDRQMESLNTQKYNHYICDDCIAIVESKPGPVFRSIDKLIYKHMKEVKRIVMEARND